MKDFTKHPPTVDDVIIDPKDGKKKIIGPMKFSKKTWEETKKLHKEVVMKLGGANLPFSGENIKVSKNQDIIDKQQK